MTAEEQDPSYQSVMYRSIDVIKQEITYTRQQCATLNPFALQGRIQFTLKKKPTQIKLQISQIEKDIIDHCMISRNDSRIILLSCGTLVIHIRTWMTA